MTPLNARISDSLPTSLVSFVAMTEAMARHITTTQKYETTYVNNTKPSLSCTPSNGKIFFYGKIFVIIL